MKRIILALAIAVPLLGAQQATAQDHNLLVTEVLRCNNANLGADVRIPACRVIDSSGLHGTYPDALSRLAAQYYLARDYANAVVAYSEALKIQDVPSFHAWRALSYLGINDYDDAIVDQDIAVQMEGANARQLNARCWLRAQANRELDKALVDCDQAMKLAPGASLILVSRELVYYQMANYPAAIADADAIIAVSPKQAATYYLRGVAKGKTGDAQGGTADIVIAEAIDPNIAAIYGHYGVKP